MTYSTMVSAPVVPSRRASPSGHRGTTLLTIPPETANPFPVVDVRDFAFWYGERQALADLTLTIPRRAVTALIGPSGCGKSTFLRSLNRMNDIIADTRHTGDILLEGVSLYGAETDVVELRRRVGMVFQRPNPFPMSIQDNVVAGARAHKLASKSGLKDIAEQRLKEVGLWGAVSGRLKDSPFRLSGGQQQLLCLARALATEPQVLLLDEPTSSLDPITTESIEELVKTLVPRLTVIIVTHNLAQARRVSDRTVFLNAGRMVEHGETPQVFEHPAEEETARYVGGRFG